MIDKEKKKIMLRMFRDGHNPYRIAKSLKLHLSTVRYNMNVWISKGILIKINPGSTPIICEPGSNYFKDEESIGSDFGIIISNYDILNRINYLEGLISNEIYNLKKEIKSLYEEIGNGSLIQNIIKVDKETLNYLTERSRQITKIGVKT